MNNQRRAILGATAAASAVGLGWAGYRKFVVDQPRAQIKPATKSNYNVLFILTDQERSWDQMPAGFIEKHCPNRAWLRSQAVEIKNANTTSQLCSMARGSIYTGTHSPNNGLWENTPLPYSQGLKRDVPTLGTVFQDAGYTTGYVGKWHLTHMLGKGHGIAASVVHALVRSYGFEKPLLDHETDGAYGGTDADASCARKAVDFIKKNKAEEKPWMLAVNFVNPHDIMYYSSGEKMTQSRVSNFPDESARPPQTPHYKQDLGYPVFGTWGPKTQEGKPKAVREYSKTMDEALGHMEYDSVDVAREFQNYYLNCMRDCDQQLGVLLEGLRQSGQLERTVVVFTSDHGEYLGAHGLRGKGSSIYREASEVPLLIRHPDGKKGLASNTLFSAVDLIPTMLSLAGLKAIDYFEQLPQLAGFDLSRVVTSPNEAGLRDASGVLGYWTGLTFLTHENVRKFDAIRKSPPGMRQLSMLKMIRETVSDNRGAMRGLIQKKYKFARYFSPVKHNMPSNWEELAAHNDFELYDLEADPYEITNLASSAAHKDIVMSMSNQLNSRILKEIGTDDGSFLPIYMRT